jgi:hypothetical protein
MQINMSSEQSTPTPDRGQPTFTEQAEQPAPSLLREYFEFLRHNKKWWLIPILLALGLLAVLAYFSASPLAPFIYPIF